MTQNEMIIDILSVTGVPVRPLKYKGKAETYITFFEYNQQGALFGDDQELNARHSIQVDIFSKHDYTALVELVHTSMIRNGFIRNSQFEDYEEDTHLYHKGLRFYFAN